MDPERQRRAAMAQHLSRAEAELRAAQRFLPPAGEVRGEELALARMLANARAAVADALENIASQANSNGDGV